MLSVQSDPKHCQRVGCGRIVALAGAVIVLAALFAMTPSVAADSCCEGLRGNVDCDPAGLVDLGDLTALIDYLFISFEPPCCQEAANIDGTTGIDIGDLTALIDYLFISFTPPRLCDFNGPDPAGGFGGSS